MIKKVIRALSVVSVLLTVEGMAADKPAPEEFRQALAHITEFDLARLEEFEKRQNEYYPKKDGIYAEYDFRTEIQQTTTDPTDPWFDLYAKGQIYNNEYKQYAGAGNMISPCHMLTAYHVVDLKKRQITYVLNRRVKFEFLKDPTGKNYTKSVEGRVVAGNNDELDYAIVSIDSLRGKPKIGEQKIPFLIPVYDDVTNIDQYASLSSGNPLMHKDASNPAALHGMMLRAYSNNQRIFGNINSSHGDSGGSIDTYFPDEKKFRLVGLKKKGQIDLNNNPVLNGEEHRETIASPAIIEELSGNNPGLLAEIKLAQAKGYCESLPR